MPFASALLALQQAAISTAPTTRRRECGHALGSAGRSFRALHSMLGASAGATFPSNQSAKFCRVEYARDQVLTHLSNDLQLGADDGSIPYQ